MGHRYSLGRLTGLCLPVISYSPEKSAHTGGSWKDVAVDVLCWEDTSKVKDIVQLTDLQLESLYICPVLSIVVESVCSFSVLLLEFF
jgi:hypothetical protein